MRRQWKAILEAAGLEYRTFHFIRSAYITAALSDGTVPLPFIQAAVGHATPAMTLRYARHMRHQNDVVAEAAARARELGRALDPGRTLPDEGPPPA